MDCLDNLNMADNTIVVFFSDNGTAPFVAPDEPFRGFKGTLYEGGIRVPLIIRWPGNYKSDKVEQDLMVEDTPVMGIDIYPTLLDLAGIDPPAEYPLDGTKSQAIAGRESRDLSGMQSSGISRPIFRVSMA